MSTRLSNEFTVPVPIEQAWAVLLDVERIAPCMPGATLDSVEGDVVTGKVRVRVGPISVTYRGQARFTGRDEAARVVTVDADGKEARGSGTASARVVAALHERDGATRVTVDTELNVTGRVAQFGRGVMADVSAKLVDRFAVNLAAELERDSSAGAAAPVEAAVPVTIPAPVEAGAAEPAAPVEAARPLRNPPPDYDDDSLDLLDIAGGPVLKRALPLLGAALLALLFFRWLRNRRRR